LVVNDALDFLQGPVFREEPASAARIVQVIESFLELFDELHGDDDV
jgi:hypothetical protein